jgi:hypothetical protein
MNQTAILWPMLAHVLLVCIIYCLFFLRRRAAVTAGMARPEDFRLCRQEPEISASTANNLANQFELPVLFHVVCLALFVTNGASYLTVALAWLFVLLSYVHALIHVTGNRLRFRSAVFAAGFVLVLMWLWLALHLAGAV